MTTNERLADDAVSHAVDMAHYSNGVVRRIIALLNRSDARLFAELTQALASMDATTFTVERLESLLISIRQLNARAHSQVGEELSAEMRRLVEYEAGHQLALFQAAIPAQVVASVGVAAVNIEQTYAAAMARPFQGVLLREALTSLGEARAKVIRDQIRIGFVEQQTTQQIVQRLRGTKAKGYADGFMEGPRRNIEAIVRTAISHTSGVTRDNFYDANKPLIKEIVWVSAIDARTTLEFCVPRDGLRYTVGGRKPIGHKYQWLGGPGRLHWNCRSSSAPVTRSWRELGANIDEFSPTTRASMDGQIAAETTYSQWLKKQSAGRQDQVLGSTRGKLFRDGGLTVEKFSNDKGRFLRIDELRQRDAEAFQKAGV